MVGVCPSASMVKSGEQRDKFCDLLKTMRIDINIYWRKLRVNVEPSAAEGECSFHQNPGS
jgi:hypothetical protein